MYKLKEPVKNKQSSGYWLFVTLAVSFMVYIMLIRPLSMPADKMPFIFEYDEKTHQVTDLGKQKRTYALLTGGAMLTAALFMIPTVRNGNKLEYASAKIFANWEYLEDGQSDEVRKLLNCNMIRNNGADAALAKLQYFVDKNKGKHIAGRKYMKKSSWDDLELE